MPCHRRALTGLVSTWTICTNGGSLDRQAENNANESGEYDGQANFSQEGIEPGAEETGGREGVATKGGIKGVDQGRIIEDLREVLCLKDVHD